MRINADFAKRVAVHFDDTPWIASPAPGVERKMLDRIGKEVARATTIVRFAPGSAFKAHTHDGGEEYLVLDGVFQDELGDFPVGSYVRNPPTSRHTPAAMDGAIILVKLHQFQPEDRHQVQINTNIGADPVLPLFHDAHEEVRVETWAPGARVGKEPEGGMEVFVVDGGFTENGEEFARWDWLRLPPGQGFSGRAGPDGARVWIKTGHLAQML
ncbi:cupin domain-containing protein [Aliisedimentitalea scapharcae]|uniref:Cupin domain-containing protein n=1 Tax=Aliisedimentitalea scapharcae TaxID=1524259 RepID=A0ABZ2XZA2_9RHOB